mmetsp:Transcript_2925/g.8958  ORF Transcript_2925/g.8958 Transcript_2925/m.8958 type:complete len:348 (+) Transcript_2925:474-1517(+)
MALPPGIALPDVVGVGPAPAPLLDDAAALPTSPAPPPPPPPLPTPSLVVAAAAPCSSSASSTPSSFSASPSDCTENSDSAPSASSPPLPPSSSPLLPCSGTWASSSRSPIALLRLVSPPPLPPLPSPAPNCCTCASRCASDEVVGAPLLPAAVGRSVTVPPAPLLPPLPVPCAMEAEERRRRALGWLPSDRVDPAAPCCCGEEAGPLGASPLTCGTTSEPGLNCTGPACAVARARAPASARKELLVEVSDPVRPSRASTRSVPDVRMNMESPGSPCRKSTSPALRRIARKRCVSWHVSLSGMCEKAGTTETTVARAKNSAQAQKEPERSGRCSSASASTVSRRTSRP